MKKASFNLAILALSMGASFATTDDAADTSTPVAETDTTVAEADTSATVAETDTTVVEADTTEPVVEADTSAPVAETDTPEDITLDDTKSEKHSIMKKKKTKRTHHKRCKKTAGPEAVKAISNQNSLQRSLGCAMVQKEECATAELESDTLVAEGPSCEALV